MIPLFFSSGIAFLIGVVIGDIWFQAGFWIILFLALVLSLFFRRSWRISVAAFLFLVIGYSVAYVSIHRAEQARTDIGTLVGWEGHDRAITGVAGELLSISGFAHRYRVTVLAIDTKPVEPFDISLSLAPNLSLLPGDRVTALGRFSFSRDTPDYAVEKQLWHRGMRAEFRAFRTEKTPPEQYGLFVRMRQWLDARLTDIFPREGHDILSGIILGRRTDLDPEIKEALKASGLMHVMVVSGSNVMMLIIFLSLFLRALTPWIRIAVIATVILAFVLLVGGDAPVWRAALMGVIGYSASLWGYRLAYMFLPIMVASLLAIVNPLSLVYDIGLQLSFLSVVCIIAFGGKLTRFFSFLGPFFDEAFSLTIAATLGTFPITLFYFGTFSLVGPIANLLAAPAIPLLMYGGILTLLVSSFSGTLAYAIGFIPWIATTYLLRIITLFGDNTWALMSIELGQYREEFMMAALTLLIFLVLHSTWKGTPSIRGTLQTLSSGKS